MQNTDGRQCCMYIHQQREYHTRISRHFVLISRGLPETLQGKWFPLIFFNPALAYLLFLCLMQEITDIIRGTGLIHF